MRDFDEIGSIESRAVIKYFWTSLSITDIHIKMKDLVLSFSIIDKRVFKIKFGCTSVNELRSGRPKSATTPKTLKRCYS